MVSKYFVISNENDSPVVYAVIDLINFIRSKSPGTVSEELQATLDELVTMFEGEDKPKDIPENMQPIFEKVAEHSGALLKASPSEFESVMNLLWYVLSSAPDFNTAISKALKQFTEPFPSVHSQQIALMATLSSLFNVVESTSPQKPAIFKHIVDLAKISKSMDQLVPQLPQLAEWLQVWDLLPETKEDLIIQLCEGVSQRDCVELRNFLKTVVSNNPSLTQVATLLVKEVLASNSVYYSREIVDLPGVQALNGNGAHLLEGLKAISDGDYETFASLIPEVSQNSAYVKKARVSAVARLASSGNKTKELPYSTISEKISLPVDEVEPVIVECIKSGLIKGRMNQLQQKLLIESATIVGPVTEQHWQVIEDRLATWKKSLVAIMETSDKARSKLDLVKSLNKLEVS